MFLYELRKPWFLVFALVFAAAVVCVFAARLMPPPSLDAFRAAGVPVTEEEFDAFYPPVPDAENAALLYAEAGRKLVYPPEALERLRLLRDVGSLPVATQDREATHAAIRLFLDTNHECVDLLHRAASCPGAWCPEMRRGWQHPFSHIEDFENLARVALLEVLRQCEDGTQEDVVRALGSSCAVACAAYRVPELNLTWLSFRLYLSFQEGLAYALDRQVLSATSLVTLEQALGPAQAPPPTEELFRAIRGDLFNLTSNSGFLDRRHPTGPETTPSSVRWLALRAFDTCAPLAFEQMAIVRGQMAWLETDARVRELGAASLPVPPPFDLQALPVLRFNSLWAYYGLADYALLKNFGVASILQLCRTALAVERFDRAHGAPPDTLEQLVPAFLDAVPTDYYTGAPLKYQRTDSGYALKSVGWDRVFYDSPPAPDSSESRQDDDITFVVSRADLAPSGAAAQGNTTGTQL